MRGLIKQLTKWWNRDDGLNLARLREEQAHLETRREKMFEDIAALEHREEELIAEGKDAVRNNRKSASRRIANQLFHLRQTLKRQNAIAGLISNRITVVATDFHNLTIASEAKELGFDIDIERLTENAVAAEECVEQVNAAADMAISLTQDQSNILESAASFGEFSEIMTEFGEKPVVTTVSDECPGELLHTENTEKIHTPAIEQEDRGSLASLAM